MPNSENKEYDLNVTHGEQIHYVYITLKELIVMQWEYIRKHKLWRVINNHVENFDWIV